MTIHIEDLENRVTLLNQWLDYHKPSDIAYVQKRQRRDYYVHKLCEMDDLAIETITI